MKITLIALIVAAIAFAGGVRWGWGPIARPDRAKAREAGSRKIAAAIYA